jgi:hydrogenase nickel incorporation protein HypB
MPASRIIDVKASILADNDARARQLRQQLRGRGVFLVNLMGSPGAGKTSLLAALLPRLCPPLRAAVVEADLDSRSDADALEALGWKAVQLRTGGFCHMDAAMTEAGLAELGIPFHAEDRASPVLLASRESPAVPTSPVSPAVTSSAGSPIPPESPTYDLVFLENVGNLICTAQIDTGAHLKLALLSVPEGDDKPLKYPVMFAAADLVVITKADYLDREAFDTHAVAARVAAMNPKAAFFVVSARTGQGMNELADYLLAAVKPKAC